MKYKIIIQKIEEKEVLENVYIPQDDRVDGVAYANKVVVKEEGEIIYEQTRDAEIHLMGIIEAFNSGGDTNG